MVVRTEKDRVRPLLQTENKEQRLHELAEQRNALYQSIADLEMRTDSDKIDNIVKNLTKKIQSEFDRRQKLQKS
jgi:shikimate kinase